MLEINEEYDLKMIIFLLGGGLFENSTEWEYVEVCVCVCECVRVYISSFYFFFFALHRLSCLLS